MLQKEVCAKFETTKIVIQVCISKEAKVKATYIALKLHFGLTKDVVNLYIWRSE